MRIARTLSFYVIRETLLYCALAFLLLTLVLLTQNLLRRLEDLFLVGMTPADFAEVLRCVFPIVVCYALPLAFLVGLLLALRRMSSDRELEAMRGAGMGAMSILTPILALALLTSALSGWLLGSVEHDSRRDLVRLFKNVAARGAIFEPGKFRYIGSRLLFVEDRNRSGELQGIMLYDRSRPEHAYRVFAERGRFEFVEDNALIRLELFNGDVHLQPQPDDPQRYERIQFDEFAYEVDMSQILGGDFGPVRPKQMSRSELKAVLERASRGDDLRELDERDPLEYALEIERRRALPFAPLLLAGVAVPIALTFERRGRNQSFILGLTAALAYYALSILLVGAAQEKLLSAFVASWTPNVIFAIGAAILVFHTQRRIES